MWEVCPAGLTRRGTKNHEGALARPGERSVQARSAKPSTATENGEQNAPTGRRVEWCARAFRSHRRQGRRSRLQPLWLLQASKPLNFQASLERPACASTPLICNKSVKSAVPLRRALSRGRFGASRLHGVSLWSFVFLAVEGLSLRACTVIAAQRSVSSPPRAAGRSFTSVAPPSLQTSKLPSFQAARRHKKGPRMGGLLCRVSDAYLAMTRIISTTLLE